jgi:hypothetical protein
MKTKEKIKQLGSKYATTHEDVSDKLSKYLVSACFQDGYTQCQEDMADNMVKLANYLRNNYQPLAPNQAEWQRIKDKKVLRIEDIIDELNKQD